MVEEQVKESSLLEEHLEGEGVESVEGGRFPQVSISKPNKDLSPRCSKESVVSAETEAFMAFLFTN